MKAFMPMKGALLHVKGCYLEGVVLHPRIHLHHIVFVALKNTGQGPTPLLLLEFCLHVVHLPIQVQVLALLHLGILFKTETVNGNLGIYRAVILIALRQAAELVQRTNPRYMV